MYTYIGAICMFVDLSIFEDIKYTGDNHTRHSMTGFLMFVNIS